MDDFRTSLLAAAQATGLVADADAADPDPAASETEPEDAASPEDALALDDDSDDADATDLAAEADEDEEDAEDAEDAPDDAERVAALEQELHQLRAQQAQWEAERLRQEQERTQREWAQAEANLDGWLQRSLNQLATERANDERLIASSEDPNALRAHLGQLRQQTERWIWGQYRGQRQVYDQHKHGAVMTALAQTHLVQWAEQTAKTYGLPRDAAADLLRYADGTPVHPDAMPARAAELKAQRDREAALKRQLTQAKRSAKAAEHRVPAAGSGQPQGVPQFKSWREELAWAANEMGMRP